MATSPLTISYGPHPDQFGELTLPHDRAADEASGVVVLIHGGFWKSAYTLELARPLASSLAARGWIAWNIEYRRVGSGGGAPETFDDVHAAIERLDSVDEIPAPLRSHVITLGHSAGGHLAVWAASRDRYVAWSSSRVSVRSAVSQCGVLDLVAADRAGLGDGAVRNMLGHHATTADEAYDPLQQVPAGALVHCIHTEDDTNVPLSQAEAYVAAANAAGHPATLTVLPGDHFTVIDPQSAAWAHHLDLLKTLAR